MSDLNKKPNWLFSSRAYLKAIGLVKQTLSNPMQLRKLLTKATNKAEKTGKIASLSASISTAARLIKHYASGDYRNISFESLALIVASIIYFVMPIDVLPDFIVGLGFVDDASLLAWTFSSLKDDMQRFIEWENKQIKENDNGELE